MDLKKITVLILACVVSAGCAHLAETGRKVWGSSITHLEKAREGAPSESFALSVGECFKRSEEMIGNRQALVYLKDKNKRYMAAMNFKGHVDTTEVGVFFTSLGDGRTQVQVASMSPQLQQEVSGFIFSGLKD